MLVLRAYLLSVVHLEDRGVYPTTLLPLDFTPSFYIFSRVKNIKIAITLKVVV